MYVIPAIDIKDGTCVRLKKGDFDTVHKVAEDPVATALAFRDAGAKWIHMVDLDGARSGRRISAPIVAKVARESGLQIEMGGGLRTMEDLHAAADSGVQRLCIGSAAVSDPEFVRQAVAEYGERIAVGIDDSGKVQRRPGKRDGRCQRCRPAQQCPPLGARQRRPAADMFPCFYG